MGKIVVDYNAVLTGPYAEYVSEAMDKSPIYVNWDIRPGRCEYNLYAHLADQFNDTVILDIGTGGGGSATALAYNSTNTVYSYDIARREVHDYLDLDNVWLLIGDFMQDKEIDYSNVSIIMIDVDPHDGVQEPVMLKHLQEVGWSGLLLMDDVSSEWPDLLKVWEDIPYERFDLIEIGHWSGTGLANFGGKHEIEVIR